MAISDEQVRHVARLSRLALTDDEVERFRVQLSAILDAVGKVSELYLEGVEPTAHPLDVVNVLAEDKVAPSLTLEEALSNAPDAEDGFFGVPAV
jgi:aspartyl-tRNA(Asn)/glutamyl-tRNA(Gln) amidotransferase subunit C